MDEAFYGFSDFLKDADKELAERRACQAGALLVQQSWNPAVTCGH